METLTATLAIYRRAFRRAAVAAARNWPVAGSLFLYLAAFWFVAPLLAPLGIAGGLLFSLLWSACIGSFLALVEVMVRGGAVTFDDFRTSFGRYLWDVVGISFLFWVFWMIVTPALLTLPNGGVVVVAVQLVIFVLLNAVPELIYLGHHSSFELVTESYAFISENWIEWFPPNMLLAVGWYVLMEIPAPGWSFVLHAAAHALYLYFAMAVRGFLFLELAGSTRRSRAFRHRMGQ
ncbi:MAG: hypothetical protein ACREQJ_16480 [Candidatus Binatia bacterium]